MVNRSFIQFLGIFILTSLGLSACMSPKLRMVENPEPNNIFNEYKIDYHVDKTFNAETINCIVVMPVYDKRITLKEQQEFSFDPLEILRKTVNAHLSIKNYGNLHIDLMDNKLAMTDRWQDLGCEAKLEIHLYRFSSKFYIYYAPAMINANFILKDKNETTLWWAEHQVVSRGGSVPLSPIGLFSAVLSATINKNEEIMIQLSDSLSRRVMTTLPDRNKAVAYDFDQMQTIALNNEPTIQDLFIHGRYQQALSMAQKAIENTPNESQHYFNAGRALSGLKQYEEANKIMLKAIQLDNKKVEYWNGLAIIKMSLNRSDLALASYEQSLLLDSHNYFALFNSASIYQNDVNTHLKAIEYFKKAGDVALKNGDVDKAMRSANALKTLSEAQQG